MAQEATAAEAEWSANALLGARWAQGEVGPLASVGAAYGLSDAVDARLNLSASLQPASEARTVFALLDLGVSYKLDVIRWVPELGLGLSAASIGGKAADSSGLGLGPYGGLGLNYLVSRSVALGIHGTARGVWVLDSGRVLPAGEVGLRLGYVFGW